MQSKGVEWGQACGEYSAELSEEGKEGGEEVQENVTEEGDEQIKAVTAKRRNTEKAWSFGPDNLADTTAGDETADKDTTDRDTSKARESDGQREPGYEQVEEYGDAHDGAELASKDIFSNYDLSAVIVELDNKIL